MRRRARSLRLCRHRQDRARHGTRSQVRRAAQMNNDRNRNAPRLPVTALVRPVGNICARRMQSPSAVVPPPPIGWIPRHREDDVRIEVYNKRRRCQRPERMSADRRNRQALLLRGPRGATIDRAGRGRARSHARFRATRRNPCALSTARLRIASPRASGPFVPLASMRRRAPSLPGAILQRDGR